MYEVTPGVIHTNSQAWVLVQHDDVVVLEFDLGSKYPAPPIIWCDDDGPGVDLYADSRTLRTDSTKTDPTSIRFALPGWDILAEARRYTLRVALYRRDSVKEPPEGLCGERGDHEPHMHQSTSLGSFWCHADQSRRLPFAAERAKKVDSDTSQGSS